MSIEALIRFFFREKRRIPFGKERILLSYEILKC